MLPYIRKGAGPVLVLVHGYLGGAKQWKQEIEFFSKDFDVIAPNLPGFGDAVSLNACDSIQAMAQAILTLLDHLKISQFHLMGHSMGGMIVQDIAATRPQAVQKLILYSTGALGMMPDRFEPIETSRKRLQADGVKETSARIAATWFKDGDKAAGHPDLAQIGSQASPDAAMAALNAMANWDGRLMLDQLTMPTLILWGDSDKSYRWPQVETLWNNIPNAQLSVVPGTAHAVHAEKPDLFRLIVGDFLI